MHTSLCADSGCWTGVKPRLFCSWWLDKRSGCFYVGSVNQRSQTASRGAGASRRLEEQDRELVALARSGGALRLALGDGLRQMNDAGAYLELGFSSLGAYAFERLGRRRRWAEDSARVARRLADLPRLRGALAGGELGWTKVELLARHAGPDDESRLVDVARASTVRALRERFAAATHDADPTKTETETETERRTLQVSVDRLGAWSFELTRSILKNRFGIADDDGAVEALLAEAVGSLLARHPHLSWRLDATMRTEAEEQRRELERRLAELTAEDAFVGRDEADLGELVANYIESAAGTRAPRDPIALDAHLRALNTRLQTRDRRLGELARELWATSRWRDLGFASAAQYANERLGCSLASIKARMTLARRCSHLPEVGRALDDGHLGFEAARLVARVAQPDTVRAWLDRAVERTAVHLREEVDVVEAIARADGLMVGGEPPSEKLVAEYHDLERAMLDGTVAELVSNGGRLEPTDEPPTGPGQMSAVLDEAAGHADPSQMSACPDPAIEDEDPGQMSTNRSQRLDATLEAIAERMGPGQTSTDPLGRGRWAGLVPLKLQLESATVALWRDVRRLFRASGEPGDFIDFVIRSFWRTWLRPDPDRVAYQDVYERERLRCASPVCTNSDLTPHHLRFRSRGGGEERDNILSLCVTCHLDLVHGGRATAAPPAGDVVWTLGRERFLSVHGRMLVDHSQA